MIKREQDQAESQMPATGTVHTDEVARLTLRLLDELFAGDRARVVGVRLWDGTVWPDAAPRPAILKMLGKTRWEKSTIEATLLDEIKRKDTPGTSYGSCSKNGTGSTSPG